MAIAFVAAADGGNAIGASSLTFSYTTGSGSNRLLVVAVQGDSFADLITGVTYNGVAMTLVAMRAGVAPPPPNQRWSYLFYLVAPATGAHNVVISASATCDAILAGAADYTGVDQSSPLDASITNISGATVTTLATSITTVTDNALTILAEVGYSANNPPTAGTGATRRAFDGTYGGWGIFDSGGAITPAGSYSLTTNRPSTSDYISHVIGAFKPFVAGSTVVAAAAGSFTFTGAAATLKVARKIAAAAASFAFTGQTADLRRSTKVAAAAGAFTFTGQAAGLNHGYKVSAAAGSFAFNGQAAGLRATRVIAAGSGAYLFTGSAAGLSHVVSGRLVADAGAFTFSGQAAGLRAGRKIAAGSGAFAFTGQAATLRKVLSLAASSGAFTFAGQTATLRYSRHLSPGVGSYLFTGDAAGLTWSGLPVPPVFKAGRISLSPLDKQTRPASIQSTNRRN